MGHRLGSSGAEVSVQLLLSLVIKFPFSGYVDGGRWWSAELCQGAPSGSPLSGMKGEPWHFAPVTFHGFLSPCRYLPHPFTFCQAHG